MRLSALILTVLLPCAALLGQSGATIDPEIKVSKIWDQGGHNAFTDLLRFSNYFYCSFREGTAHSPGTGGNKQRTDGLVRIIRSRDGIHWESVALMAKDSLDLRDPKMSVTPDGRIMVNIGGSVYRNGKLMERYPQVSFSDRNGLHFSAPQPAVIDPSIVSHGDWIWRVTWHKGIGYATDYQIGPLERRGPTAFYILTTRDGIHYKKLARSDLDGFPNEATIRFDNKDSMFILIRRELADTVGVLAKTAPPYTDWQMKKLDFRLGGPNFIFTRNGQIILGTRASGPVTALFFGNKAGDFREILQLPSGGDNSYPGLLLEKDTLWVSYYSSHEGKAAIYFARIPYSYISRKAAVSR